MIARLGQRREVGPFAAGGIENFVRRHGNLVDAAPADGVDFSIQNGDADRAARIFNGASVRQASRAGSYS